MILDKSMVSGLVCVCVCVCERWAVSMWCVVSTLSSQRRGRWSRISSGSASAAITTNSARPRFRAFVAAGCVCVCVW